MHTLPLPSVYLCCVNYLPLFISSFGILGQVARPDMWNPLQLGLSPGTIESSAGL
jgi:hypothetical protein